jgi:hypothetical protein
MKYEPSYYQLKTNPRKQNKMGNSALLGFSGVFTNSMCIFKYMLGPNLFVGYSISTHLTKD